MKTKKKNQQLDYLKANRKGSREAEIENYGHPINYCRIQVSKKVYNRKKMKGMYRNEDTSSFVFIPDSRNTIYFYS